MLYVEKIFLILSTIFPDKTPLKINIKTYMTQDLYVKLNYLNDLLRRWDYILYLV